MTNVYQEDRHQALSENDSDPEPDPKAPEHDIDMDQKAPAVVPQNSSQSIDPKNIEPTVTCTATKRNGESCTYKAKHGIFCGTHKNYKSASNSSSSSNSSKSSKPHTSKPSKPSKPSKSSNPPKQSGRKRQSEYIGNEDFKGCTMAAKENKTRIARILHVLQKATNDIELIDRRYKLQFPE